MTIQGSILVKNVWETGVIAKLISILSWNSTVNELKKGYHKDRNVKCVNPER